MLALRPYSRADDATSPIHVMHERSRGRVEGPAARSVPQLADVPVAMGPTVRPHPWRCAPVAHALATAGQADGHGVSPTVAAVAQRVSPCIAGLSLVFVVVVLRVLPCIAGFSPAVVAVAQRVSPCFNSLPFHLLVLLTHIFPSVILLLDLQR